MNLENIQVPKHEILKAEEAEKVLEFYKVTPDELPKIKRSDPALKGMKAEVGDIIKITRKSPTAGESFYYRVVIDD
ncbi:MAG: DNA-directed RNA polymerase subunit H [Candidatus Altiarchaeales archaeon]|nr:MAG: DNA-directed RNA polymerase subunit H [Candidatus Altiarchaeales archaeon]HDI73321.1 DNA-directed RNA polymerase subunit H [Candidatus Altiarchaeales archaeon]